VQTYSQGVTGQVAERAGAGGCGRRGAGGGPAGDEQAGLEALAEAAGHVPAREGAEPGGGQLEGRVVVAGGVVLEKSNEPREAVAVL
jgi:hypothetical protein